MMGAMQLPEGRPARAGLLDATMVIRVRKTPVSRISFFIVSLLSGGNSDTISERYGRSVGDLSVTDEVWAELYHKTGEAENK
jgi:hypothetical protein